MRELCVLLKYGLKGSFPRKGDRKLPRNLLLVLFLSLAYGLPLSSIFFELFRQTSPLSINGVDFPTILISFWSTTMIAVFFSSFFANLVNSFVKNEEIAILLSYPLKRSSIALYQMILTFISQAFVLVMYFSVFIAYSIAMGYSLILTVFSAFLMCAFVFSASLILASSVGLLMRRSTARIMNIAVLLLSVAIFLVTTQMLPQLLNWISTDRLEGFINVGERLLSSLNIFAWPILTIKGNYLHLITLFFLTVVTWFLSLRVADKLTFEENQAGIGRKGFSPVGKFGLTKKEMRILLRQSQTIMMFLYPTMLWLILAYTTKSTVTPIFLVVLMSSLYVSTSSALLVGQELYVWPMPRSLPVDAKALLRSKIFLPPLLFCGLFSISLILVQLLLKVNNVLHILDPVVFSIYLLASMLGVETTIRHKKAAQILNPSRVIPMWRMLQIQIFVVLASLGSIFPIVLRIERSEILWRLLKNKLFVNLFSFGLPMVVSVVLILLCLRRIRSVASALYEIE